MSPVAEHYSVDGELIGYRAHVNVQVAPNTWRKRKKVHRIDTYGGRRAAKAAATEWEVTQKALLRRGQYLDPVVQRITLAEYWQTNRDAILDGLRPNVRRNYEVAVRLNVGPVLGSLTLAEFRPSHVDELKRHLRKTGIAPSTANGVINALSRILAYAVREGRIPRNYARDPGVRFRVPKALAGDRITLDPSQVEEFAAAIDRQRLGYGDAIRVAFYTGCRAEELWALQAGDVDLSARRITIRGSSELSVGEVVAAGVRGGPGR